MMKTEASINAELEHLDRCCIISVKSDSRSAQFSDGNTNLNQHMFVRHYYITDTKQIRHRQPIRARLDKSVTLPLQARKQRQSNIKDASHHEKDTLSE